MFKSYLIIIFISFLICSCQAKTKHTTKLSGENNPQFFQSRAQKYIDSCLLTNSLVKSDNPHRVKYSKIVRVNGIKDLSTYDFEYVKMQKLGLMIADLTPLPGHIGEANWQQKRQVFIDSLDHWKKDAERLNKKDKFGKEVWFWCTVNSVNGRKFSMNRSFYFNNKGEIIDVN